MQQVEALPNLWEHRERLSRSVTARLDDLTRFDDRLVAQVETLAIEGDEAADLCRDVWRGDRPGEIFGRVTATLAWRCSVRDLLGEVTDEAGRRAFVSAFGFVEKAAAMEGITDLCAMNDPVALDLAARALRARRAPFEVDGATADEIAASPSALVLAGWVGDTDGIAHLDQAVAQGPAPLAARAAWARWMLRRQPADLLRFSDFAGTDDNLLPYAAVAFRLAPIDVVDSVLGAARRDGRPRVSATIMGAAGLGRDLPALQAAAQRPDSRLAALRALHLVTGSEQIASILSAETSPDEADEALSEADETFIRSAEPNTRYLAGKPLSDNSARSLLRTAPQVIRLAAAVELARNAADRPIFNVFAPAPEQRRLLLGRAAPSTDPRYADAILASR